MKPRYSVAIGAVFLWIGFVAAISFMEAWLKFRAPGITIPLGLGIGRLVFAALNLMEWVFVVLIAANLLWSGYAFRWMHVWLAVPILLLIAQSAWLLPALDVRAEMRIQGMDVPPSNLHITYIAMEVAKVASLLTYGISLLKSSK